VSGRYNIQRLDELATGAILPASGSNYFQRFSTTPVLHLHLYNLGAYVQDQWAVTPHLKVTATVRLERNGNPYCADRCFARLDSPFADLSKGPAIPYNQSIQSGLSHAFYAVDAAIPQPRVGIAYNPAWSKSTVFRGGVGLFSDLYPAYFAGTMAGNPPDVFSATIRSGLLNTVEARSAAGIAAASAGAFEKQFAGGATLTQLQQAVAPASFAAPGYTSIPPTMRSPRFLEWSFEIERQFGTHNVLTLRYAGNRGYYIFLQNLNVNAYADPGSFPHGFGGLPATAPDVRFAQVNQLSNNAYSNYHGFTASLRRRFGRGFEGQIAYTWSHSLDTVSDGGLSYFSYDSVETQVDPSSRRALNYSNSDYDVRHSVSADFVWEIPRKFRNKVLEGGLGGWSIGAKFNAHTGLPFSVVNSGVEGLFSFGGTVMADVLDPKIRTVCGHSSIDTPCFTAGQFVPSASQSNPGNLPRNAFRGPGLFNIDTSVWKMVPIGERMRFRLGASAFNLLNHPNFADPNSDVNGSGFGLIRFTVVNPSGPYGWLGGPSGRALVANARFVF